MSFVKTPGGDPTQAAGEAAIEALGESAAKAVGGKIDKVAGLGEQAVAALATAKAVVEGGAKAIAEKVVHGLAEKEMAALGGKIPGIAGGSIGDLGGGIPSGIGSIGGYAGGTLGGLGGDKLGGLAVDQDLPVFEDKAITAFTGNATGGFTSGGIGGLGGEAGAKLGGLTRGKNLELEVASGDSLDVRNFSVHERLSSLFQIQIVALSDNPSIDFDAVVGHPARFALHAGAHERFWTGLCNHFEQVRVEPSGLSTYQISIVPTLWLLTQRKNYRMFQQISEPDIVLAMLKEWNIEADVRIDRAAYKKRKYRVQYAESDFAFISRMLEDAGITYYFEQVGEQTKLVLSDAPQVNQKRALPLMHAESTSTLRNVDAGHATSVRMGQRVRPGKYTLRDHDYRRPPSYKLMSSATGGRGIEEKLERYDYTPGAFLFGTDQGDASPVADDKGKTRTDEKEAGILAQKRLDAKRGSARVCSFETTAHDLAPGMVMSMSGHPHDALGDGKALLIVESSLNGTQSGEWGHHCEARGTEVPFRPEVVTPKPSVNGVESATVVGQKGEEIHTDEFGRVRVHFHWDRESKMDENSSCWIHVSQAWGGAGYGGSNLPRVGQEVLVDFLGGDPDRPVIVGRVYTNLQKTPYKLPANKTQSGLKSNSTGGGGGYSELMFEDAGGSEFVRFQAERDFTGLVKHDMRMNVQNDSTHNVGNNDSESVIGNQTVRVAKERKVRVKLNQQHSIGQNIMVQAVDGETKHLSKKSILHWSDEKIVLCAGPESFIEITKEKITIQSKLVHINPGMTAMPTPQQPPEIGDATVITGFIGSP